MDGPVMSGYVVPCVWLWGIMGAENIILLILSKALRGEGHRLHHNDMEARILGPIKFAKKSGSLCQQKNMGVRSSFLTTFMKIHRFVTDPHSCSREQVIAHSLSWLLDTGYWVLSSGRLSCTTERPHMIESRRSRRRWVFASTRSSQVGQEENGMYCLKFSTWNQSSTSMVKRME